MDAKKRVLMSLNNEEPDKVPSFELSIDNIKICDHYGEKYVFQGLVKSFKDTYELSNGDTEKMTSMILSATETRSYLKNALKPHVDLYRKIGIDFATVPYTGYVQFPMKCFKDYFIDEFGRIFDLKKNPSDQMDIAYYRTGAFTTFEDYEAFEPYEVNHPRREKYVKTLKKTEKAIGGSIYLIPSLWGIFESTWQGFGFSNFARLLGHKKKIKKVFDDRGNFALELVKAFIDWGEDGVILIYDDYGYKSQLLIHPKYLKEFVVPWIKRICDAAHKRGVKIILHSCGQIFQIFDDLVKAGIDAIHPLEPTTANPEYDIFKLHEKYGDHLTFVGNVSPQDLADKTPSEIYDYTKKLIKELAPGGGYILSSGHSINPAVKLENFLAMRKA
ncbi:MAG: uroporphyrinogen decarboxylase family protein, partial [Promethearchaeota archaeon]